MMEKEHGCVEMGISCTLQKHLLCFLFGLRSRGVSPPPSLRFAAPLRSNAQDLSERIYAARFDGLHLHVLPSRERVRSLVGTARNGDACLRTADSDSCPWVHKSSSRVPHLALYLATDSAQIWDDLPWLANLRFETGPSGGMPLRVCHVAPSYRRDAHLLCPFVAGPCQREAGRASWAAASTVTTSTMEGRVQCWGGARQLWQSSWVVWIR